MKISLYLDNSTTISYKPSRANRIENAVNKIFKPSFEGVIGVHIVGVRAIRALNRKHRKKDLPTDVLSFPMYNISFNNKKTLIINDKENLGFRNDGKEKKGTNKLKQDKLDTLSLMEIGDVFVCANVARQQARQYNHSVLNEIDELIIHGICHIFGLNHETPKEYDMMHKYEQKIILDI